MWKIRPERKVREILEFLRSNRLITSFDLVHLTGCGRKIRVSHPFYFLNQKTPNFVSHTQAINWVRLFFYGEP
jgi:hypothetical protein